MHQEHDMEMLDHDVEILDDLEVSEVSTTQDSTGRCCSSFRFNDIPEARAYALLGIGRGAIVMANVFLSASLIFLASLEAGCVDEETNEIIKDCGNRVYGFTPASLITNVAVISGLLAAFFMPMVGAIIDYTPYRRLVGVVTAVLVTVIQGIQIFTTETTWFAMAILQAIVGFILVVQMLATFAYLPEVARCVPNHSVMNHFTKWFVFLNFSAQCCFLIAVIAVSFGFGLDYVRTGQFSQILCTICLVIFLGWGWKLNPHRPAVRKLPKDRKSIVCEAFLQNWRTLKLINRQYNKGLKWFLLATAFAEAGATSLLPIAVTFLQSELHLDALQIGTVFLLSLFASLPGTFLGAKVTALTDPNRSLKLNLATFGIVTAVGAFVLVEERTYLAYVWGLLWGVCFGWFYPAKNLFFSLCVPSGMEAELTGLFIYANLILVWLPPLIFSVLVEVGVEQRWGMLSLLVFEVLGILILTKVAPWEEVIEETKKEVITPASGPSSPSSAGEEQDGELTTPRNRTTTEMTATTEMSMLTEAKDGLCEILEDLGDGQKETRPASSTERKDADEEKEEEVGTLNAVPPPSGKPNP
jgi:UMF1 family MFS transporter